MEHVFTNVVSFAVTKALEYGLDSYYEYRKKEDKKIENSIRFNNDEDSDWLVVSYSDNT
jgi:hypothetical protein